MEQGFSSLRFLPAIVARRVRSRHAQRVDDECSQIDEGDSNHEDTLDILAERMPV
jgi:hypothetical protein